MLCSLKLNCNGELQKWDYSQFKVDLSYMCELVRVNPLENYLDLEHPYRRLPGQTKPQFAITFHKCITWSQTNKLSSYFTSTLSCFPFSKKLPK